MITPAENHFKNLDASRFFAFLLIFFAHAFIIPEGMVDGFTAVVHRLEELKYAGGMTALVYFFVLSGFLINRGIQSEIVSTGSFDFRRFMARRILRILPLYFFVVLLGFLVQVFAAMQDIQLSSLPPLRYFVSFTLNFYIVDHGLNFLFFLTFLWIISVELQFYLFWGICMRFLKTNGWWMAVILITGSLVFRTLFIDESRQLFFNSISLAGDFGVGILFSCVMIKQKDRLALLLDKRILFAVTYGLLLITMLFYHDITSWPPGEIMIRLWMSVLMSVIIYEQAFAENKFVRMGRFRVVEYLGKISYSLYCLHGIFLTVLAILIQQQRIPVSPFSVFCLYPAITLLCTLLASMFSFALYKKSAGKWKQYFTKKQ